MEYVRILLVFVIWNLAAAEEPSDDGKCYLVRKCAETFKNDGKTFKKPAAGGKILMIFHIRDKPPCF